MEEVIIDFKIHLEKGAIQKYNRWNTNRGSWAKFMLHIRTGRVWILTGNKIETARVPEGNVSIDDIVCELPGKLTAIKVKEAAKTAF